MLKSGWIGFLGGPDGLPFWETAKQLADMGYAAMDNDVAMMPGGTPTENAKKLRDMGIEPLTVAAGVDMVNRTMRIPVMKEQLEAVIKSCKEQDIKRVTLWGGSAITSFMKGYGNNGTYDELMEDIEAMNYAIPILADEGLSLCYHNHYQEFTVYHNGVSTFDHLLVGCDPRLMFDLDAGWITVSGNDPVQVMRHLEGRLLAIHLKDIYDTHACKRMSGVIANNADTGFTALGTGLLDVQRVSEEADRQGIEYGIVEQDRLRNLDTLEALTMARLAMVETGYFQ